MADRQEEIRRRMREHLREKGLAKELTSKYDAQDAKKGKAEAKSPAAKKPEAKKAEVKKAVDKAETKKPEAKTEKPRVRVKAPSIKEATVDKTGKKAAQKEDVRKFLKEQLKGKVDKPADIAKPKSESPAAKKAKVTPKAKEKVAERKASLKEMNKSLEKTRGFRPAPKLSGNTKSERPLLGRDKPSKGDGPIRNDNITKQGRAAEGVKAPSGGLGRTLGRVGRVAGKVAAPLALAGAVGGLLSGDSTKSRAETERKSSTGANKPEAQTKFKEKQAARNRRSESVSHRDKDAPGTSEPKAMRFSDYKLDEGATDYEKSYHPKPETKYSPVPKDKGSANAEYKTYKKDSEDAKSFREAFASAKGKEFTWRGRKYSGKRA